MHSHSDTAGLAVSEGTVCTPVCLVKEIHTEVLRTASREGRHGTQWGSKDTPMLSILLFVKTQSKCKKT